MLATHLTFAFQDVEDRLILIASDDHGNVAALALTRRLTGRLIDGLASTLERSSATVSKAPVAMRSDIVLMEHQGALTSPADPTPRGLSGKLTRPPHLVTGIDVRTRPRSFQLVFHGIGGVLVRTSVSRSDLHRIIAILKRKAEAAEWNLHLGASWLERGQTHVVLN